MWNSINGLKQYYTDRGNTEGIPIVFIHGFPFDHSMWEAQVNALPAKFRPVTYDIRGHGLSESGSCHYSLEFFADDLFALIEHLNLDKPIICGLSMGGYITLRAFERKPDAFRALILCDTRSEADTNEAKIKRSSAVKTIEEKGVQKYAEDSVNNLFWEANVQSVIPAVSKIRTIIENMSADVLCATLIALAARTDTTEVLDQIKIPVLIMVGEHDKLTPPIAAESLHENITGSELQVIKNAAHLSNLENPEEFNGHLLSFLSKMQ
jgi:3-oxoadipate enol-lactonase